MSERNVNILYGLSSLDGSSGIIEKISQIAPEKGINVIKSRQKIIGDQILECFDEDGGIDVLICQQHQANGKNVSVELIENIRSKAQKDLLIIMIVDEQGGSPYLNELISHAVFNAVFAKDATVETILDRIASPMNYSSARFYYGLSSMVSYNGVSREVSDMVRFVSAYDSADDLRKKLVQAADQVSEEDLFALFINLPDEALAVAGKLERFSYIVKLASGEKAKRKKAEDAERSYGEHTSAVGEKPEPEKTKPAKKKQGKKAEKKAEKKVSAIAQQKGVELGFMSVNKGVGCTYSAMLCANSLKESGYKVAIVEFDDKDRNFSWLAMQASNSTDVGMVQAFPFGGVDYFFNMPYQKFRTEYLPAYDFAVYDFGCCPNDVINDCVVVCERVFVVASPQEYRYGELLDFVTEAGPLDLHGKYIYLFPACEDERRAELAERVKTDRVVAVPMDRNPYHPAKDTVKLFTGLVCDPVFSIRSRKKYVRFHDRPEKADHQDRTLMTRFGAAMLLLVFAAWLGSFAAVTIYLNNRIRERDLVIAGLNGDILKGNENYDALKGTLDGMRRTIVVLKEPVNVGTLLTNAVVEEKEIYCDLPDEVFSGSEEVIGRYAACGIEAGLPVYSYHVADKVEPLPLPETAAEETSEAVTEETAAGGGK